MAIYRHSCRLGVVGMDFSLPRPTIVLVGPIRCSHENSCSSMFSQCDIMVFICEGDDREVLHLPRAQHIIPVFEAMGPFAVTMIHDVISSQMDKERCPK